eukprot:CAMPEP_0180368630 /NCGR_PEP_ID=MMETSP0989-20121125/17710_1 /TAXON_ID=697907 /ORGANISM="non described non described, Strain CCMP2293" /LENGTH=168 /DNA_ID=CAMNT_0022363243 /DNA_START=589 /DNA_END=1092 /DNA_ORIENTATION=-
MPPSLLLDGLDTSRGTRGLLLLEFREPQAPALENARGLGARDGVGVHLVHLLLELELRGLVHDLLDDFIDLGGHRRDDSRLSAVDVHDVDRRGRLFVEVDGDDFHVYCAFRVRGLRLPPRDACDELPAGGRGPDWGEGDLDGLHEGEADCSRDHPRGNQPAPQTKIAF